MKKESGRRRERTQDSGTRPAAGRHPRCGNNLLVAVAPPTPEIATGEGKKARKDGQNLDQMRDFER